MPTRYTRRAEGYKYITYFDFGIYLSICRAGLDIVSHFMKSHEKKISRVLK